MLDSTTTDRDDWKEVGDYTVVAKSSNDRLLTVERTPDMTFWLLHVE